jgi:hypothetical protein
MAATDLAANEGEGWWPLLLIDAILGTPTPSRSGRRHSRCHWIG